MSASIAPDHLELADRLAELRPLSRVRSGDVEGALGDPDGLRGDAWPAAIERPHRQVEALTFLSDPVRIGDPDAAKAELRRGRAADAHLVLDPLDREAVHVLLDNEAAEAAMAGGVVSLVGDGEDRDEVGDAALADEPLRSIDDPVAGRPVAAGAGPGGRDVAACLGLGQRKGDELPAGRQIREPALLLLIGPGQEQRQ